MELTRRSGGRRRFDWRQAQFIALAELAGVRPPGMRWTPARIGHALGLDINGHDDGMTRKRAWKQEIVAWARSRQSAKPPSPRDTYTDAFDLSDPNDQYLHRLIARDVAAGWVVEAAGQVVRGFDRDERGARIGSPSHIAGSPIAGKYYSPNPCPECETKLPSEPQCPDCTAAYEGRRAVARAETGVAKSTAQSSNGGLRNTNSSEEFMARQLPLMLTEPVE